MYGTTERDLILSMDLLLLIRLDSISLDHNVPILLDHYIDITEFQKVSPLGTQHINFLGKYIFEEKEINTEDGLRPLKIETIVND